MILAASGTEKPAEAVQAFENAARRGRSESAAAAEIDAAKMLAADGKAAEAIDRLKRAIESSSTAAPKDALLFTLAQIYESTGAAADARVTYQRLITDFPNSPVPRRRAAEGPAVLTLLHGGLVASAALAAISLVCLAINVRTIRRLAPVPPVPAGAPRPRVSVVVPARNEAGEHRGLGALALRAGPSGPRGDRGRRPLVRRDRAPSSPGSRRRTGV